MTSNTAPPKARTSFFGVDGSDPADHPGAQVFLDHLDRGRRRRLAKRGFELDAMGTIVDPIAIRLNKLAGRDHRGMADDGDQIALPACFDPQNAEAVLRVVKRDAVDQPGQDFREGFGLWRMLYRHRRGYQLVLTFSELCKLTSDGRQKWGAGQRKV
jgi:hypothetical protein